MCPEILKTLIVLVAVIAALAWFRAAPDLILLGGLTLLILTEVISPARAFAGLANEGLVAVAALYVVAEGLRQTGGMNFIGQRLLGQPRSLRSAQARILVPTAALSAFMNNTPVVAMMMPVIADWAKKLRLSVSALLMPLSYAAILGGLCTLIGTSTTLVVNGLLMKEQGAEGRGLSMFELAWVGVPAGMVGGVYLLVWTKWLLPNRVPAITPLDDPREYTVEMIVTAECPLIGRTIEEAGLRHLPGMYLMEIDRGESVLAAVAPTERLQARDRLVFVGIVESVVDLRKIPGLEPATEHVFQLSGHRSERSLVEAVVSGSCPFVGTTIRDARFRSHYDAAVIAVARDGRRLRQKIGDIELLPGDTLLLEATPQFLERQRNSRDFFLVSQVADSSPVRHERAWIARLILLGMVALVTTGLLSMLEAALLAAGLMIVTGCCRAAEARRAVDLSVLLTMAAGLGIGQALEASGTARYLAGGLIEALGENPWLLCAVIYAVTMVFTNIITAKAAAVLFFPMAMAAADSLQADIVPFAVVVMISSAASFATPIGYQTNLMVYGPGGYRFGDYLRVGGPLSLIVAAVTLLILPFAWPF